MGSHSIRATQVDRRQEDAEIETRDSTCCCTATEPPYLSYKYYSTVTYCYWGFLHYIKYMKLHQTHETLHNHSTAGSRTNRSAMPHHPSRLVTLPLCYIETSSSLGMKESG